MHWSHKALTNQGKKLQCSAVRTASFFEQFISLSSKTTSKPLQQNYFKTSPAKWYFKTSPAKLLQNLSSKMILQNLSNKTTSKPLQQNNTSKPLQQNYFKTSPAKLLQKPLQQNNTSKPLQQNYFKTSPAKQYFKNTHTVCYWSLTNIFFIWP